MRAYWLLGILMIAVLGVGIYELILWPGFHLTSIEVGGLHVVGKEAVVRRAAIDPKRNLWLQNLRTIEARIALIPYVEQAYVHRILPASVWIGIVERRPDGCVVARDRAQFTVDGKGRVLEAGCARIAWPVYRLAEFQQARKPGTFLHSAHLARLQADAHALEEMQPGMYTAFGFDTFDQFEATMRGGILVRFGSDADLAAKARLVDPILSKVAGRFGTIEAVDVRALGAPVVEYRASHAQD